MERITAGVAAKEHLPLSSAQYGVLTGEGPFLQWHESVADGDSLDWKDLSSSEITKRVMDRVQPGSIILFHNAALHTPEALPGIIESLLKDGYRIVPISELILPGDYVIDHTGKQVPVSP